MRNKTSKTTRRPKRNNNTLLLSIMNRQIFVLLIILVTVASTLVSCNRSTIYSHYCHTSVVGWDKSDTLTFEVSPLKSDAELKSIIGIRVNDKYPFKALCLIVEQTIYPDKVVKSDTINCRLFEDDGKSRGRGVSCYQHVLHYNTHRLMKGDSLSIRVHHNMKREILPGISDIGITLEQIH